MRFDILHLQVSPFHLSTRSIDVLFRPGPSYNRILDIGYRIPASGYRILDAGYLVSEISPHTSSPTHCTPVSYIITPSHLSHRPVITGSSPPIRTFSPIHFSSPLHFLHLLNAALPPSPPQLEDLYRLNPKECTQWCVEQWDAAWAVGQNDTPTGPSVLRVLHRCFKKEFWSAALWKPMWLSAVIAQVGGTCVCLYRVDLFDQERKTNPDYLLM